MRDLGDGADGLNHARLVIGRHQGDDRAFGQPLECGPHGVDLDATRPRHSQPLGRAALGFQLFGHPHHRRVLDAARRHPRR